jgi:hypothetical protein
MAARCLGACKESPRLALWATASPEPSGLTLGRRICLNCATAKMATYDFYRVLAHEFGHALLPRMCGFREPEECAEGYIGEVLFLADARVFGAESPSAQAELAAQSRARLESVVAEYDAWDKGELPRDMKGIRILAGGFARLLLAGGQAGVESFLDGLDKTAAGEVVLRALEARLHDDAGKREG